MDSWILGIAVSLFRSWFIVFLMLSPMLLQAHIRDFQNGKTRPAYIPST